MKASVAIAVLLVLSHVYEGLGAKSFSTELLKRSSFEKDLPRRNEENHLEERQEDSLSQSVAASPCVVSAYMLIQEFSKLAVKRMFMSPDGDLCTVGELDHHDEGGENQTEISEFCDGTFHFMEELLVRLNLTSRCCLGLDNQTTCEGGGDATNTRPRKTSTAQAFGYGFLMIVLVSLASLVGLTLLPFTRNKRMKKYYQYVYGLLIAMGASALFCDAVLHLIPEAFELHEELKAGQSDQEDGGDDNLIIWRSCVVILGLYAFFIFEFILHSWNNHTHSTHENDVDMKLFEMDEKEPCQVQDEQTFMKDECIVPAANGGNEVTFPHGRCINDGKEQINSGIIHPIKEDTCNNNSKSCSQKRKFSRYLLGIKPLAWLIIFGDGIHNFADGLALGAAISQSLSLGISTTIALVFHEVPHELGDFVILLSTGMSWYGAMFFNFMSALTAIVGFFVGAGIGTNQGEANSWILAITAGVFLYISLVDLVPELIHTKEKGCKRVLLFVMINIGFAISFVAMLLLAVYEEELDNLVSVT